MQVRMEQLKHDGYLLLPSVFDDSECKQLICQIEHALERDQNLTDFRQSRGTVYAARNLLDGNTELKSVCKKHAIESFLENVFGSQFGLVRLLYFDKPSHRSWSIPFHKDMTIAVENNSIPSRAFSKPTRKAGVDHIEAPVHVLQNMLTIRVHLDKVTSENGPLQVVPGSHLNGKEVQKNDDQPTSILCESGDVLAMRPLISHGSGHSNSEMGIRRRILHYEFCSMARLPDGFQWKWFET